LYVFQFFYQVEALLEIVAFEVLVSQGASHAVFAETRTFYSELAEYVK
jgi:hypothetical protein